jgi:hypothetical protein
MQSVKNENYELLVEIIGAMLQMKEDAGFHLICIVASLRYNTKPKLPHASSSFSTKLSMFRGAAKLTFPDSELSIELRALGVNAGWRVSEPSLLGGPFPLTGVGSSSSQLSPLSTAMRTEMSFT